MSPKVTRKTSTFSITKGAMIDDTYTILSSWDLERSLRENLSIAEQTNPIAASSHTMLRDKLKVLRRRLDPSGKDRALTELTKAGCSIDVWRPLLLWHIARGEYLLWDFLTEWLFERSDEGALFVSPEDLRGHIRELPSKGVAAQSHWTDSTVNKMTSALLKMGEDFGLLKGGRKREIAGYTLPEPSTMYLLHAIRDKEPSSHAMINAGDWRIFQMRPEDVERELVLLHQLGRLTYNAAGSIVELELPEDSALGYARRHMV